MPIRPSAKANRIATNAANKAAVGLARWATTDHSGTAKLLANLPPMGFFDTLSMIAVTLLCSLLGALVSGVLMFLLVAYGIPMLLTL